MSTTSLLGQLAEREGAEYPFPTVGDHTLQRPESLSTGSSDSDFTPPYLARSLPSHHSSSSRHRHRTRNDRPHRARDEDEDGNGDNTSTKLLSQLVSRSNLRDVKQVRTLLILTNDRLEAETRRADQAEQRVVDALHRLRSANEATALAQADASRAQQQVRLYELQIQQAQSEINRAQEIVNEVERARRDAEEEAARARSVARKCKEQRTPEQDPGPIAVHNIPPSPSHPRVDVPPDGWIPYAANNDSSTILIPPPHELSGAVSPVDPSPTRSEAPLPVPNQVPYSVPGPSGSYRSNDVQPPQYASSVQSRDYAFGGAPLPIKPPSTGMNSPQSTRPSTMSQYDLLVPPPNQERIYRQGVDRQSIMAGSGPADEPPRPCADSASDNRRVTLN
ncbi:hypothetical protein EW026_g6483 [Hermanssonia centrifuga]|uniref:Uncharacterized protein n=1 Tax=Hermanssonia centrifuga TaxID=98765 RepID=A0A4S4KAZ1_9APHY|nr:hypothetical protein EW026_g6483 [Hermanssonia centrifuga]